MPSSLDELVELLEVEQLEVDLYRGTQPRDSALVRVFGGQVAAQALMAASATVDAGRRVHSLHSYFILGGDPAIPIVYDVQRIRDGGSFSTRRVSARQHGEIIYYLTASFHREEPGWDHQDVMPDVPKVEDSLTLDQLFGAADGERARRWREEWAALEVRYVGDNRPEGGADREHVPAVQRLWFRGNGQMPAGDDPALNAAVLTYASDLTLLGSALVPHGVIIGSSKVQAASLDHAVWFHRDIRADEWMLYDQTSPSASGARGFATGNVYAQDGTLVASVAQEGLVRPVDPSRKR
ncbi:acyl-CoA thioesterase [Solicola sp. PLA-1-18]|uniref:acyl-CoA thioesterase n=1 Tax=Solicola sp. PLA-1-18 TaxID=3380532 RepID=UPI003B7BDF32